MSEAIAMMIRVLVVVVVVVVCLLLQYLVHFCVTGTIIMMIAYVDVDAECQTM